VSVHLGDIAVQDLTKRHIDDLVAALREGGGPSPTRKTRKPWKPRSVNYTLSLLTAVLEDQMRQGRLVLKYIEGDRYAAAWHLALSGLRAPSP
jgi:integrase